MCTGSCSPALSSRSQHLVRRCFYLYPINIKDSGFFVDLQEFFLLSGRNRVSYPRTSRPGVNFQGIILKISIFQNFDIVASNFLRIYLRSFAILILVSEHRLLDILINVSQHFFLPNSFCDGQIKSLCYQI